MSDHKHKIAVSGDYHGDPAFTYEGEELTDRLDEYQFTYCPDCGKKIGDER